MRQTLAAILVSLAVAVSLHAIVQAQGSVGQNINVVTGSADQFIGDMFRQRQNESVIAISSVNPAHMMIAYNDYRTVDFVDPIPDVPPSLLQGSLARLLDVFRLRWGRPGPPVVKGKGEGTLIAAAQAWVGLSFSDNGGKDWYTGLHPGHASLPAVQDAEGWDQSGNLIAFDAASDPVVASTHDEFFVGGIAFTPGGSSAGFVSRFTDRNNTETGQNIHFDGTRVVLTQPARFFVDKPSVAAAPGAPNGKSYVYAAFVVFDESDPKKVSSKIVFYRSANSGESWSGPVTVSQPLSRNQAPWIVVDPNNPRLVYLGWRVFAAQTGGPANAIVGKRSSDGGATFTPAFPYPVALLLKAFDQPQGNLQGAPPTRPSPRSNAYPTAVIDGSGGIHVALQEYVNPNTGVPLGPLASPSTGVPRITVTSSYNGGLFWTPRRAVDFGPGTGTQFVPVLAVVGESAPSCPGRPGPRSRVMLMYYDGRAGGIGVAPGGTGFVAGGDKQFDVRMAEASACNRDSLGRLVFDDLDPGPGVARSLQVSQYTRSARPPHNIVTSPAAGFEHTAVNRAYPMFCGGNCAFSGDYLHLIPRVPYVQTATGWKLTTATGVDQNTLPAPVVQGVWADTRDVFLPTSVPSSNNPSFVDGLPWWDYSPPGTGLPSCINPGSRDQNIYTAEYTPGGLFAAAPETFRPSNIPHAYPVYLENRSNQGRLFRLTIDADALASFTYTSFEVSAPAPLDKEAFVAIGPYSTVTGSIVVGPGQTESVVVSITEVTVNNGIVTVVANGAKTVVTLFTAGAAAPTQTETHAPAVDATPRITKPFEGQVTFPVSGTPFTQNPFTQNPFTQNPFTQNPFTQNPFTQNPFTQNPFAQAATIHDVIDVSFQVKMASDGNQAAAFSALLQTAQTAAQLQGSYFFQVFINRIALTPGLEGCLAADRSQNLQVSSIVTPFTQNPFTQNPFTQNPFTQNPFTQNPFTQNPFTQNPFTQNPFTQNANPNDPAVSNSTFYLAPPPTPGQTSSLVAPDLAPPASREQLARRGDNAAQLRRVGLAQAPAPTSLNYRADRPIDEIVYTIRAFQTRASADPQFVSFFSPAGEPKVGLTVVAATPDVIVVDGVARFDPAGPKTSSGGSAVPVKVAFLTQPGTATPGATMSPVRVAIQDGFGNTVASSTLPVTLAIGSNPGKGTLSGTTTQMAVNGVATFPNLSINNAGTGYTLVALSPGLTGATSLPFDIASLTVQTFVVTNTNDSGPGSLRQAILNANTNGNAGFTDAIVFDIPGEAPHTIAPTSALPGINDSTLIDATPSGACTSVAPTVEIDGVFTFQHGLFVGAGGTVIRGLSITRFASQESAGIFFAGGGGGAVECSYLGLAPDGVTVKGNFDGVRIGGSFNNTIGGMSGAGNVISGNLRNGVLIVGPLSVPGSVMLNKVQGNFIGTDATGSLDRGNGSQGVHIIRSAGNTIGGDFGTAFTNVISGNGGEGVRIDGATATNNLVAANIIGSNSGSAGLGNGASGVYIRRAPGNSVRANFVYDNRGFAGIAICGNLSFCGGGDVEGVPGVPESNASGNVLQQNAVQANQGFGVSIDGAPNTLVGGTNTGASPNGIIGNGLGLVNTAGVVVFGPGSTGNRIQQNNIFGNTGVDIDLGNDGVTPNDAGDADSGPNNLQNFPTVVSATTTQIDLTLNSTPNTTFDIDVVLRSACDLSGIVALLPAAIMTTDGAGNASLPYTGFSLIPGQGVTATATGPDGSTSEFSVCTPVAGGSLPLTFAVQPSSGQFAVGDVLQMGLSATGGTPPYHFSLTPSAPVIPGMRVLDGQPLPQAFPFQGAYAGVIAAAGNYDSALRVTDSLGQTVDEDVAISVVATNVALPFSLPNATAGVPYSFTLPTLAPDRAPIRLNNGIPNQVSDWSASDLPPGLLFDFLGRISGTPKVAGNYSPTFTQMMRTWSDTNKDYVPACNFAGTNQEGECGAAVPAPVPPTVRNLVVDPFAITTSGKLPQGTVGTPYPALVLEAPGCGSGCTWTALGDLPPGISVSTDGIVSGTPGSTFNDIVKIQAAGSGGIVQKVFALTIASNVIQPLAVTTVSPGLLTLGAGVAVPLFASGGIPPYTWTILPGGTRPSGVALHGPGRFRGCFVQDQAGSALNPCSDIGLFGNVPAGPGDPVNPLLGPDDVIGAFAAPGMTYLAGRFSSESTGIFNFKVAVTDAAGATVARPLIWLATPITPHPDYLRLPIAGNSLTAGSPYVQSLLVLGGSGNYGWTNTTPMPAGLILDAGTGVVSGTPSTPGLFSTTIRVTDDFERSVEFALEFNIGS